MSAEFDVPRESTSGLLIVTLFYDVNFYRQVNIFGHQTFSIVACLVPDLARNLGRPRGGGCGDPESCDHIERAAENRDRLLRKTQPFKLWCGKNYVGAFKRPRIPG